MPCTENIMPNKWNARAYERRVSTYVLPTFEDETEGTQFLKHFQDSSPNSTIFTNRDRQRNQRDRSSHVLDHRIFSPNDSFSIVDFD